MADYSERLISFCLADATISGLIGTRLYARLPQNPILPAVTLTQIDYDDIVSTDGRTGLETSLNQLDIYAASAASRHAVSIAFRDRLNGYRGEVSDFDFFTIKLVRQRDLYDSGIKAYRRTADYDIWNEEST